LGGQFRGPQLHNRPRSGRIDSLLANVRGFEVQHRLEPSRTAQIDLVDLYHNESQILGSDSLKLDVVEPARRLDRLSDFFDRVPCGRR
jgi:hypothetical protein